MELPFMWNESNTTELTWTSTTHTKKNKKDE